MNKEVVILGGGIAGLSAAVHAIEHGFRPIILEKNRFPGGRLRSFESPDIKRTIDNGQHVISAAYQETIHLLKTVGSLQKIYFQKNFNCLFLKDPLNRFVFRTVNFPTPLHFFIPLMTHRKHTHIEMSDYLSFIRTNLKISTSQLKQMTVKEWLDRCTQGEAIRELLWYPFTLAILNTPVEQASAYLLFNALKKSFLHSRRNARLGLPRDWLSEIFIQPTVAYIKSHGGSIYFSTMAHKLITENRTVSLVVTRTEQFDTPWLISTLPSFQLLNLLEQSAQPEFTELKEKLSLLKCSPIVTINIFLQEPIRSAFPIAPIQSPLQWIFPHPVQQKEGEYGYTIVISGAASWIWRSNQDIISTVGRELHRLFGTDIFATHRLKMYKIVKEKRATILQTPRTDAARPKATTPFRNFFLAGDWTQTELPATIESAVLSSKLAIQALMNAAS